MKGLQENMLGVRYMDAHDALVMCSWPGLRWSRVSARQQQFDLLPVLSLPSASRLTARCAAACTWILLF
jgi:hypothetical protein